MKKFDKYYFEKVYKKEKNLLWGSKPNPLTVNVAKLLPKNASVLDIGCGEGKDAIYLAKKGFCVTAVDISKTGIKKLKEQAKKEKVKLKPIVADLVNYKIDKKYNAIIALASIHFLEKEQIKKLINKMKDKTKKGGLNLIIVFRKGDASVKEFKMYYFDDRELSNYYSDWKIIYYNEYSKKDQHGPKGKIHYHQNADLIVQKLK